MLTERQLRVLTILFRRGADEASFALTKWLGRTAHMASDQVQQLSLAEAAQLMGSDDEPVCACVMSFRGGISGRLISSFDDASGILLAEILLGRPLTEAEIAQELHHSAALETANIIGCAYLNTLSNSIPLSSQASRVCVPDPPSFARDFGPALMGFLLMDQAEESNAVFLTQTQFHIEQAPVCWTMLLVPDLPSLKLLREVLA